MRSPSDITVLFFGDVVGRVGRRALERKLPFLRDKYGADLVLANSENATHGRGCSHDHYVELTSAGIDLMTSGNHFFDNRNVFSKTFDWSRQIRPVNLSPEAPLEGSKVLLVKGRKVRVINALGAVEMNGFYERPYPAISRVLEGDDSDIVIVDFHAEASGEKICLARALDGRISLFAGTHTHVQTNDDRILPKGTGYITDLGMCGLYESCLGAEPESAVRRSVTGLPGPFEYPETGTGTVEGICAVIGEDGRTKTIEKIRSIADI